ncbi:MAG TPA: hypothetical protein VK745_31040 [Polyangiaceae bacterium]|nr:hypothetical protein [Polyangiaceae bacterium]
MFRSVMMNKTQLGLLGSLVTLAVTGCIAGPGANAPCGTGTDTASSSSSSSSGAADVTKIPIPAGVAPTGPVVWDGTKLDVVNIDPPGTWFYMNDHSPKGEMEPATNGDFQTALSNGMVHTHGKMYTEWGGGIGLNFVGGGSLQPVDASQFKGIKFKASGSGSLHVGLATAATMPDFGICTACYGHYSVDINDLSSTPKEYSYTWDKLPQAGFGKPKAKLDPKTLIGLNFTSKGATTWDFSIGEIDWIK